MADHAGLTLHGGHPVGRNPRPVRRRWQPGPLRRLGEATDHVLDPGRGRDNERPCRVGLDAEGVGRPARGEHHIADRASAPTALDPQRRISAILGELGRDQPGANHALEQVPSSFISASVPRNHKGSELVTT